MKGLYLHYKGGIYKVLGEGIHTETEEKLVFYCDDDNNLFARPKKMFFENVTIDGVKTERFSKII